MKQQHFLPPPAFLAFLASLPPCLPARLRACVPAGPARRTDARRHARRGPAATLGAGTATRAARQNVINIIIVFYYY